MQRLQPSIHAPPAAVGKLAGLKLGQVWLIQLESFEAYLANAESTKDLRFCPK